MSAAERLAGAPLTVGWRAGGAPRAPQSRRASPPVTAPPLDVAIPGVESPPAVLADGVEGRVVLELVIDTSGRVRRVMGLGDPGHGLREGAARSALARSLFAPARVGAKPVATECTFTVIDKMP